MEESGFWLDANKKQIVSTRIRMRSPKSNHLRTNWPKRRTSSASQRPNSNKLFSNQKMYLPIPSQRKKPLHSSKSATWAANNSHRIPLIMDINSNFQTISRSFGSLKTWSKSWSPNKMVSIWKRAFQVILKTKSTIVYNSKESLLQTKD